ncbi:hypothetical protein AB1N83_007725 [Pleurotus pulmonarius]
MVRAYFLPVAATAQYICHYSDISDEHGDFGAGSADFHTLLSGISNSTPNTLPSHLVPKFTIIQCSSSCVLSIPTPMRPKGEVTGFRSMSKHSQVPSYEYNTRLALFRVLIDPTTRRTCCSRLGLA